VTPFSLVTEQGYKVTEAARSLSIGRSTKASVLYLLAKDELASAEIEAQLARSKLNKEMQLKNHLLAIKRATTMKE